MRLAQQHDRLFVVEKQHALAVAMELFDDVLMTAGDLTVDDGEIHVEAVPLPSSLVTVIAPSWFFTIPRTTARPRPVPRPGGFVGRTARKFGLMSHASGRRRCLQPSGRT